MKTITIEQQKAFQEAVGNLTKKTIVPNSDKWRKFIAERNKAAIRDAEVGKEYR